MDLTALIPLFKLFEESGAVSPKRVVTPPSSKAGLRPDCGIGKKAVLIDGEWVCITQFD